MTEIKPATISDESCTCPIPKSGKSLLGLYAKKDHGQWVNTECPVHTAEECVYCGKTDCKGDRLAYDCGE